MNENKDSFLIEVLKFSAVTLLIVLPFRMYIAKPFIVSGASMSPTFETGNYLIVDQISFRLEKPKRGEIVIFKYPKNTTRYFIKRIIGLPNETVKIKEDQIIIKNKQHPKGFILNEKYLNKKTNGEMVYNLKKDEYFVMGDNRPNSSDSRIWGAVNKKLIVGRVFLRLLPINKVSLLPGDFNYSDNKDN